MSIKSWIYGIRMQMLILNFQYKNLVSWNTSLNETPSGNKPYDVRYSKTASSYSVAISLRVERPFPVPDIIAWNKVEIASLIQVSLTLAHPGQILRFLWFSMKTEVKRREKDLWKGSKSYQIRIFPGLIDLRFQQLLRETPFYFTVGCHE